MDESTDRSSEKHVVFVIRYLDGDAVRTSFMQIEKMEDDKAETVYDCPTLYLQLTTFQRRRYTLLHDRMLMVNSFRDSYLGINTRKAFYI